MVEREAPLLSDPRLLSETDLQWLIYLFRKKYDSRYDPITTEAWYRNVVLKSPLMFYACRLDDAFQISMMSTVPWLPNEFECHVVALCADDGALWQAMRLLHASINWAKLRRCRRWRLSSDTEFDFAGLARRLGATEISPRFTMEL